jgi:hypothetical protein
MQPALKQWEYLLVRVSKKDGGAIIETSYREETVGDDLFDITEHLNGLGEEGWELVSCMSAYGQETREYVFKKPLER